MNELGPPKWRTKKQIAAHFALCERTVTNLQRRRVFPYVKLGKSVRFDLELCEAAARKLQVNSVVLSEVPSRKKN